MKRILCLTIATLLIFTLCACSAGSNSQQQQQDYDTAVRYMKQGKYEDAISAFNALGDYSDAKDRAKYCEAQSYCYAGDYQSAYNLLVEIPDLEEANVLLREIFFETRLFEGLTDLRKYLKNPNSLSLTSVQFTYSTVSTHAWTRENPVCIVTTSAQNGLGGYSTSYVLFTEEKGSDVYMCYGYCKSLNYDNYDSSSDTSELLTVGVINSQLENTPVNNPVNLERVNTIIELQKYSSITRIPEQTHSDIEY